MKTVTTYTNLEKYNWWTERAQQLGKKLKLCITVQKFQECLVKAQFAEARAAYYLHLCRSGKSDMVG